MCVYRTISCIKSINLCFSLIWLHIQCNITIWRKTWHQSYGLNFAWIDSCRVYALWHIYCLIYLYTYGCAYAAIAGFFELIPDMFIHVWFCVVCVQPHGCFGLFFYPGSWKVHTFAWSFHNAYFAGTYTCTHTVLNLKLTTLVLCIQQLELVF